MISTSRLFWTRLFWTIVGLEILLCLVHAWFHLTWRGLHSLSHDPDNPALVWTDMRWDLGPHSWLSWATMLLVGITALSLARIRDRRERWGWLLVGTLFSYLALDDALSLHERLGAWAQDSIGPHVYGWVVVLLPVLAVLGGIAFVFLVRTVGSDRRRLREIVFGFSCLGAAVVLEILEPSMKAVQYRLRGFALTEYTQVVEEFLELLGPALLLRCLGRVRETSSSSG